ncbi:hypothetical protein MRX96_010747 [Rhipicephalus microplus]
MPEVPALDDVRDEEAHQLDKPRHPARDIDEASSEQSLTGEPLEDTTENSADDVAGEYGDLTARVMITP